MLMPRAFSKREHDELLRMWKEGIPASTIAATLGEGRTRNSVLGYVYRLRRTMPDLQRMPTPKRTRSGNPPMPRAPRPPRPKPIPVVQVNLFTPIIEETPPEGGVPYFETRLLQCKYILNTSKDAHNIKCCGGTVHRGTSWCRKHYEEVFTERSGPEIQVVRLLSGKTQAASKFQFRQR